MLDYIRIACAVPPVQVGNVTQNVRAICGMIGDADEKGADVLVFPELAVTGYTCADLFFQDALLDAANQALDELTKDGTIQRIIDKYIAAN